MIRIIRRKEWEHAGTKEHNRIHPNKNDEQECKVQTVVSENRQQTTIRYKTIRIIEILEITWIDSHWLQITEVEDQLKLEGLYTLSKELSGEEDGFKTGMQRLIFSWVVLIIRLSIRCFRYSVYYAD